MSTELSVKWLLYTLNKNQERGFNVIAIIVFLFILGLLTAIFLPSFLKEKLKCKMRPEVVSYLSAMNKVQQYYYTENGKFITEDSPKGWGELGLGVNTETNYYKYSFRGTKKAVFSYAMPRQEGLRAYVGGVFIVDADGDKETMRIVCMAESAGDTFIPIPILKNGVPTCAPGTIYDKRCNL